MARIGGYAAIVAATERGSSRVQPTAPPHDRQQSTYSSAAETARLTDLLTRLTLSEKVQLVTGRDFWTTHPIATLGLRRLLFCDGPSDVRGEVWDERSPRSISPRRRRCRPSGTPGHRDTGIAARYGAASAVVTA